MTELYATVIGASKIAQEELRRKVLATVKDGVPGGSHHSIGTQADVMSQEHMLTVLRKLCPDVKFLAEENCRGPDVITDETLHVLNESGSVFILDALDGTAGAYRRRWDWSVCGNLLCDGHNQSAAWWSRQTFWVAFMWSENTELGYSCVKATETSSLPQSSPRT